MSSVFLETACGTRSARPVTYNKLGRILLSWIVPLAFFREPIDTVIAVLRSGISFGTIENISMMGDECCFEGSGAVHSYCTTFHLAYPAPIGRLMHVGTVCILCWNDHNPGECQV